MSWTHWPFYPLSLSDAIPMREDITGQDFVSLIISGISERLRRALTVIEPVVVNGALTDEKSSSSSTPTCLSLRRIDATNPNQNFETFCSLFRANQSCEAICLAEDFHRARKIMEQGLDGTRPLFERYQCHNGLIDYIGPVFVAGRMVAVVFTGQFFPVGGQSADIVGSALLKISSLQNGLDIEALRTVLTTAADNLQTEEKYLSGLMVRPDEHYSNSALSYFEHESKELGRIVESEWRLCKAREESTFMQRTLASLEDCLRQAKRADIAQSVTCLLDSVRSFCGTAYIALFATEAERISYSQNQNLCSLFASSGIPPHVAKGIQHLNRRSLHFEGTQHRGFVGIARQECRSTALFLDNSARIRAAVKGPASNFFEHASILVPVMVSERCCGTLVLGPCAHISSIDLSKEVPFLSEIGSKIGLRILHQLHALDSDNISAAWLDTAALLAHNSRRGWQGAKDAVRVLRSRYAGEEKYTESDVQDALACLEAGNRHLGMQARMPLEAFAARAEQSYDFREVDLRALVNDCVALYNPVAKKKHIQLEVSNSVSRVGCIPADKEKYSIALGHLVDNAVKYSHPDRVVIIRATTTDTYVVVEIDDFGLGIDDEDYTAIYERGKQGRRSRAAESEPGEGFGLYHANIVPVQREMDNRLFS